ncbi:MAG: PilZ domain-containing protein [Phycisphaerales bacterium]
MTDSGLIVRRSVRYEISMPARLRVAPHHADALGFAKGVCGENRWIDISIIDFAAGGLGFIIEVFLPRNVDLELEIPSFLPGEAGTLLSCIVRVQRVQMTDRRPAYKVGAAFVDTSEAVMNDIEAMLDRLSEECDSELGGQSDA